LMLHVEAEEQEAAIPTMASAKRALCKSIVAFVKNLSAKLLDSSGNSQVKTLPACVKSLSGNGELVQMRQNL